MNNDEIGVIMTTTAPAKKKPIKKFPTLVRPHG